MDYDHIRKALLQQRKIMTHRELAEVIGISPTKLTDFIAGRYREASIKGGTNHGRCTTNKVYQALGIEVETVRVFKLKDTT